MSIRDSQSKHTKRVKTQGYGYSAFDESIVELVLSKMQKVLYEISKSKFDNVPVSIKHLQKDIHVMSEQCKDRPKITLLSKHIMVFDMIHASKFETALEIITKKEKHFTQKTNKVLKLSISLLKSLIFKFLLRQQESRKEISSAISQIDLKHLKMNNRTKSDQKIIELTIVCITIIAQYFGQFEKHETQFRDIYKEAYRIALKYLTQYHKLTQMLFVICNKFPDTINENIKNKQIYQLNAKKRNSVTSNRSAMLNSQSDMNYVNFSVKPETIGYNESFKYETKTRLSKRLRTLDQKQTTFNHEKQKHLNKLYGDPARQLILRGKASFKRPKLYSSFKATAYFPQYASEMKELQSISKIYLPKLQTKRKQMQSSGIQKLNAKQIIKFGQNLSKLKPKYFDEIQIQQIQLVNQNQKQQKAQDPAEVEERNSLNDTNRKQQNHQIENVRSSVLPEVFKGQSVKGQQVKYEKCQLI